MKRHPAARRSLGVFALLVGVRLAGGCSGNSAQNEQGDASIDASSEGSSIGFAPSITTQENDFLLALSSASATATLCYTLDGSTPACAAGACKGTSQAYSAAARIAINGSVTDATTGQVSVSAVACEASGPAAAPVTEVYTLQAAAPRMTNPAPGADIPWVAAGLTPTLLSSTVASPAPASAPTIWVTTDGSTPSCLTGTSYTNPTTFDGASAPSIVGNTAFQALTCKAGYLPSPVSTFTYSLALKAPVVAGGTFNAPIVPAVTDPNGGSGSVPGEYLCVTSDGTMPACGAAGTTTCAAGGSGALTAIGKTTSPSTVVSAIACHDKSGQAGGIDDSSVTSATFILQYAPPWLNAASSPLPARYGWDFLGTGTPPGLPTTTVEVPAAATLPWAGTFSVYQVGDLGGLPAPNNTLLPPPGYTAQPPTAQWAVAPHYTIPDYFCWQYCASGSTCAAVTCGSAGACATSATSGEATFGGSVPPSVSPGDTISLVGCENAPSSPATEIVYQPSAVTTVSFAPPAAATAPAVSAPTTPQTTASITNTDPRQSTICWTYSSPAVTPTCSAGSCTSPAVTAASASEGSVTLAGSGAPQGFAISAATTSGPTTSLTIASTVEFYVGMPVIIEGNSNPLNNGMQTVVSVTSTALIINGGGAGSGGTVGGYISDVFDFVTSGTSGLIEANGYVLSAIACNAVEVSSPVASQTYTF